MVSIEELKSVAALAGYAWTDDELRAIAPLLERSLALIDRLGSLPLRDVEPGIVFRIA
jgi:Asp-tRNA(Asn)/Glu-tRNA(Gln) amidotransferase C subunit